MRLGKLWSSKRFLALSLGIGMPLMLAGAFAIPSLASAAPTHANSVTDLTTWYGPPDNSPPGNGISGPACGTPHGAVAGGVGSFANPTTYADPQNLNSFCQRAYDPFMKMDLIHQDQCNPCGGQNTNHIDIWIGGTASSNATAVESCENDWTTTTTIIQNAPSSEPVDTSPVYSNSGGCAATHGGNPQPHPGSGAGGASGEGGSFGSGSGGGGGSGSGAGGSGSGSGSGS